MLYCFPYSCYLLHALRSFGNYAKCEILANKRQNKSYFFKSLILLKKTIKKANKKTALTLINKRKSKERKPQKKPQKKPKYKKIYKFLSLIFNHLQK